MSKPKTPLIPTEVITYLDYCFNTSLVRTISTQEELMFLQGQLNVVDHLRSLNEVQKKNGNILNVQNS